MPKLTVLNSIIQVHDLVCIHIWKSLKEYTVNAYGLSTPQCSFKSNSEVYWKRTLKVSWLVWASTEGTNLYAVVYTYTLRSFQATFLDISI